MVYIYGTGFLVSHSSYYVVYYDSGPAGDGVDGVKRATDTQSSTAGGVLSSQYDLMSDPAATAGTWHATVYDSDVVSVGEISSTYTASDKNSVIEDDFKVLADAIPELPTILAAVMVPALSVLAYLWMRRRAKHA
ncbi:hypothetical protein ACFLVD_00565 [Chloroflexota bacterium]